MRMEVDGPSNPPPSPGKNKPDHHRHRRHLKLHLHRLLSNAATSPTLLWSLFLLALAASYLSFLLLLLHHRPPDFIYGDPEWEREVSSSARPRRQGGHSVLVTGAAGFIGSHLALSLRKRGDGVVGLDSFDPYYDPSLKRARAAVLASRGVPVVAGNLNNGALLAALFRLGSFTHVAHMAAQAGVRHALKDPSSYVSANVAGLVSLLEACRWADPQPAVVWASSSSVYGLNRKVPFSESDRTDRPASLYAATKKAGEEITHTYNHIHGLSMTGLRFFTVYGPWGRPDMAYFSFTHDILQGKPITVYKRKDGGDLARDFTYIDDIVKGCVGAIDTAEASTGSGGKKHGPAQYRIYNLGNTQPITVPMMVSILEKHLKVTAETNFVEMPANGDVPFTHANITAARRELGYKPTTDLDSGLKKFARWYRSYYGYSKGERKDLFLDF